MMVVARCIKTMAFKLGGNMNKRMKELAMETDAWCDLNVIGDPKYNIIWEEKFAELIVGECCSKLVEMGERWHEFAKNPPDGQAHNASGALFAAYRLKEDAVDEI